MKIKPININNLNIDMSGKLCVIDDSGDVPKWKKICNVFPSCEVQAKKAMREHNLKTAWLIDEVEKILITIN